MKIELREATQDDCLDIFNWRNDPVTRAASFNIKKIPYKDHKKWFAAALKDKTKNIKIVYSNGLGKIGMIRFDKKIGFPPEISIVIAPSFRGQGLGVKILALVGKKKVFFKSAPIITARIKKNNLASVKAFVRAGFISLMELPVESVGDVLLMGKIK